MQKRHFVAIARAVKRYGRAHGKRVFMPEVMAEYVADEIGQFSASFDRTRFIEACTPEGGQG